MSHLSLHGLVQALHPLLIPLCFMSAWAIVISTVWSIWAAVQDGVNNAKQMHQIPCANCRFFTNNYYLKCPVHPQKALSDAAINCIDYEAAPYV
ncbi:MAG TPA: hypothetical protein V6C65_10565 [Allocoleopsis sp.]